MQIILTQEEYHQYVDRKAIHVCTSAFVNKLRSFARVDEQNLKNFVITIKQSEFLELINSLNEGLNKINPI